MTRVAWTYISIVLGLGAVFALLATVTSTVPSNAWLPFAGLTLLATLSQLFQVEVPGRQTYYPHTAFFFAGVLLLPPSLFVALVAIPHLLEWAKERLLGGPHLRYWYIQPFNIAAHIISGSFAYVIYQSFHSPVSSYTPMSVLAATMAATGYVVVNHLLVGIALVTARDISWRGAGVLNVDSLLPDFIMACCGYIVAVLLQLSPWMALPALAPMVLVHRVFVMLKLRQDNLTDPKTGLWNRRHFENVLNAELERGRRFNRYLTVMAINLDLSQDLKHSYGRLAVDTVLIGVGRVIKSNVRQYDMAAHFEGEKFALLLPETNPFESLVVAERLRSAIESAQITVETSDTPLSVTASLGVSCFPGDGVDAAGLLRSATIAAEYAKQKGSNKTVCFADVPMIHHADEHDKSLLNLRGEIYTPPTDREVGFANPTFRNS
jgi:diguanylate cyclase (GGDEF)-like protein